MNILSLPRALPLLVPLLAALPAPTRAQAPADNPCADSLYQALRGKSIEQLSEREYEYFMQREKACTEHQRLAALVDAPSQPARPRFERELTTEAYTQQSSVGNGVDVFIRNTSPRPIIVNSVRVFECRNLRGNSCGVHHTKARIAPGQARRVLILRFNSEHAPASYRFEYNVTEAQQP